MDCNPMWIASVLYNRFLLPSSYQNSQRKSAENNAKTCLKRKQSSNKAYYLQTLFLGY